MRDLAAALAALPILAVVYAETLARRLRLAGVLALPVLATVYAGEAVRRPRLGVSAVAIVAVPLLALGALTSAAPAALDARPPDASPTLDAAQLRPIGEAMVGQPPEDGSAPGQGAVQPFAAESTAVPGATSTAPPSETQSIDAGAPSGPLATTSVPPARFAEPIAPPPAVVRFRPMGSSTDVDQGASLSVRFDRSMEREATAAAFSATIDGEPVTGSLRWAEDDTVLVLEPDQPLPHGVRVTLRVEVGARATDGQPLVEPRAISFTVEPKPTPTPAPTPRPAPASRDTGGSSSGAGRATGSTAGWGWPLDGPITQYFGQSLTIYGTHRGLDIDGDTGDPIRAAASGTVVVAGYYDACGGLDVHIDHGDGLVTWYRHLSRVLVSVGQRVDRGDLIGRVGSAGCSTGSHLHFAVRRGSTWLDPLDFLPRR